MKERAYAKINMSLDVFNIREDGYHDINSIMVPIDFYDELEIEKSSRDEYVCNRMHILFNRHNSIIKMINIVKERFHIDDHYSVKLNKHIPIKAGLGGGTSDAAAALRIMERMYELKLTDEERIDICLKVGADVPFNYYSTPAVVSGLGDVIEPFEMAKEYEVLLVKPRMGVSTVEAYESLNMDICDHPDIDALRLALTDGDSIEGKLGNSLEQPALKLNREVAVIKNRLGELGAKNVLMSGSGSTVFAISEDKQEIADLHDKMSRLGYFTRLTRTLNR